MTPHTFKEHIQQRRRWGRGVISTARQLRIFRRTGLSLAQKLSYMSSVVYWYSPIKNLIYICSPLLFATFAIPVFKCGWLDLMIYWAPMFIMQDVCLRVFSHNAVSLKWSGIYETSVMPQLLIPVIKETLGITAKKFEVTDKSKKKGIRKRDRHAMIPFIVLLLLSAAGIVRSIYVLSQIKALGVVVLLFWLIRNAYYLVMSLFLVDGRDSEDEGVEVIDAELAVLKKKDGPEDQVYDGITTYLNEHRIKIYLDEDSGFELGDAVEISIMRDETTVKRGGIIIGRAFSRLGESVVYTMELTDHSENTLEYLQVLYDRIPTLPQSLTRDYGIVYQMLRNLAFRVLR
jgi:cellulose synthase (UDP-forming)